MMRARGAQHLSFEGHTLDVRRGCLTRDGHDIELRPKSFQVLRYLVENARRLVSKDELAKAVWPNVVVTDESLARCISEARQALGDGAQRILRTIPRRGYLFNSSVRRHPSADVEPPAASPPPLSIAVLPFVNLGCDAAQDYFADAITHSLTTDLAHLSGAFVIASKTAHSYKGKALDARRIGHELGVRYLLDGSLVTGPERVRVNAQLIDTATGAQLWADRFDKLRGDILDLQDEITAWLARLVGIRLVASEGQRAERERGDAMTACDLAMRGMAIIDQPWAPHAEGQAVALFEAALRLDPANINALLGLAAASVRSIVLLTSKCPVEQLRSAEAAVAEAARLAPLSTETHYVQALVHFATGAPERAVRECDMAIALNPNHARAHAWRGWMKLFLGRPQETEPDIAKAMRLVPRDPQLCNWHNYLAKANLYLGRIDEAIEHGRQCTQINPSYCMGHVFLAGTLACAGKRREAADAATEVLRQEPGFRLASFRRYPRGTHSLYLAQRERLNQSLCLAGLPE